MYHPISLFIGLRYTRAKRRNHFISFISLISMLGIALGVIALITVLSVMNGFHKEVRERILGMASHADIRALEGGIEDWHAAINQAVQHPRVIGAAPYIEAQTMLVNGSSVSGALVRGILPASEPAVVDVTEHMVTGSLDTLRAGEFHIVLGSELASVLGVGLEDKVTVVVPQTSVTPVGVMPRMKRFQVTGIFEVGMGDYDRGVAMIHMDDAAKLQRLGDKITGVRLKLVDLYEARKVSHELARSFNGLFRVLNWTDYHKNFFAALETEKRMMSLILSLIVGVAAFNIISTLVMVVTDKQSDIAVLRSMGASPGTVMKIFIVQGAVIGLIGTLLGVIGGVLMALNTETVVDAIETWFGMRFIDPDVYYISKLPSDLHWSDVASIGIGAFLISLLATLYPAWRAARTRPAEALRYE